MANKVESMVANYDALMQAVAAGKKFGEDHSVNEAPWLMGYVQQLHPHRLKLRVEEKFDVTDSVKSFRLVPVDQYLPPFQAGQYIKVMIERDGICTGRPYSISSSPKQRGYYEITVRRKEGGLVSNFMHDNVQVGDILTTTAPSGHIYYNPVYHCKKQVLLAGGSGITPFLSMIREVTDCGLDREVHLIYGSRSTADVPYIAELRDRAAKHPNFKCDLVISEPDENWQGPTGFINAELIKALGVDVDNSTFYICGPQGMHDFCVPELHSLGVPDKRIRREMFGAADDITRDAAWPENISGEDVFSLTYNGRTILAKASESVLTALERAGVEHESCCRSGVCSMCRMKLMSGKVFQASTSLLRRADAKAGYIHTCASYPISDIEIAD